MDQEVDELHEKLRKLFEHVLQEGADGLHDQDSIPECLVGVLLDVGAQGDKDPNVVENQPPRSRSPFDGLSTLAKKRLSF